MPRPRSTTSSKDLTVVGEGQLFYLLGQKMPLQRRLILGPVTKRNLKKPIFDESHIRITPERAEKWAMLQFDVSEAVAILQEAGITQEKILKDMISIYNDPKTSVKDKLALLDRFRGMHAVIASMWAPAQDAIRESMGVTVEGGSGTPSNTPRDALDLAIANAS